MIGIIRARKSRLGRRGSLEFAFVSPNVFRQTVLQKIDFGVRAQSFPASSVYWDSPSVVFEQEAYLVNSKDRSWDDVRGCTHYLHVCVSLIMASRYLVDDLPFSLKPSLLLTSLSICYGLDCLPFPFILLLPLRVTRWFDLASGASGVFVSFFPFPFHVMWAFVLRFPNNCALATDQMALAANVEYKLQSFIRS